MNRLISYPRSGNHWVRFIIEYLSNRPTAYLINNSDVPIYKNNFTYNEKKVECPISIKNEVPIFYKQHDIDGYDKINVDNKIILIIRDLKEVVIRHNYDKFFPSKKGSSVVGITQEGIRELIYNSIEENEAFECEYASAKRNYNYVIHNFLSIYDIDAYFKLLRFYDKFDGKKLLIKYENLINNIDFVAKNINNFLEIEDEKNLNEFIKNKNYFSEISKRATKRSWVGSVSENDLNYHKDKVRSEFPKIDLSVLDEYMVDNYKDLILKYNINI